ncbi:Rv3654c family TadE-like protein [Pseudoglutamicibacter cumminsii]|uniref:Rv3654c family TadE-like protein n=1 Tax=Pseudoglutamicibacter cumminsii TaxID=156979 RepID=UPI00195BE03B|nr:Rv3654c family TadE-like protein [Pseudoglutamicibacter cumminsii]MBM7795540.1 secretion/DNA translocation related TadE-like protein [Pseudoglutamicibacter cumminsii]
MKPTNWSEDRGGATGLVIGLLCIGLIAALGVAMWAVSTADQARAKTAADLAALAAADAHRGVISAGNPCALAAEIATKHDAELTRCTLLTGGGAAGRGEATAQRATVHIVTQAHRTGWLKGWPLPAVKAESYAGPPTITAEE